MFGLVTASTGELTKPQLARYGAVYCGVCRSMGKEFPGLAKLGLQNDCAFLALLLMSLYEPEETLSEARCLPHPIKKRPYLENEYIRYAAGMNTALMCYKALDDWQDDKKLLSLAAYKSLSRWLSGIEARYPRQCGAISDCVSELSALEKQNCPSPDKCAGVFGRLMASLFLYRRDRWQEPLTQMGMALGKFIYLADAAMDYPADRKKGRYNPYIAMGMEYSEARFREHLTLAMAEATESYEMLPLVQDKDLLDNILYSGVWTNLRFKEAKP